MLIFLFFLYSSFFLTPNFLTFDLKIKRELAAIHRADLVLLVSHFEKDLLTRQLGISHSKLEVAPFYYENIPHTTWKSYKAKVGFSMIGHFKHPPNRDAIHWMKRDIWPKIKKLMPSATLDVFGAHPDKSDMLLSDPSSGFRVVGPIKADELTTRLQRARVSLAPIRYGAGIKGKIAENWFSGTPTVTTSIGSESMTTYLRQSESGGIAQTFGGEVADDADSFARASVGLYIDPTRWHRARGAGYEILTHNFNMSINSPLLQDSLWRVVEEREKIRDQNLVGSILWSAGYRYNEMFGRFVQMKTLASQKHAQSFVSNLSTAANGASSQKAPKATSSSATAHHASSSTTTPSPLPSSESQPAYPREHEDSEVNEARGLKDSASDSPKPKTETFTPNTTRPTPIIHTHAPNNAIKSELEDTDRQFVFGVLAAEQERLATRSSPRAQPSFNNKAGLSETDASAFVAFKKSLK